MHTKTVPYPGRVLCMSAASSGKSRGRGIQLTALLSKIHQVGVGRGAEARWIAQKYMENPLIIGARINEMEIISKVILGDHVVTTLLDQLVPFLKCYPWHPPI
eukprot:4094103-Amphidinium_carterae.1